MKYKGYTIKGKTAYARGAKFRRYPSAETCAALRAFGVIRIVWCNGDFIIL